MWSKDTCHSQMWFVSGKTIQPEDSPTFVETWRAMEGLLADGIC